MWGGGGGGGGGAGEEKWYGRGRKMEKRRVKMGKKGGELKTDESRPARNAPPHVSARHTWHLVEPGSESSAPAHCVQVDCPATLNSLARHMPETAESAVALQKKPASHGRGAMDEGGQ